uniref:CHHC U11-48K-type domain-containing protein n=1 Tax=Anopheles culicifacies TaxID=139723 RepID=A0A182MRY0_9DIPT
MDELNVGNYGAVIICPYNKAHVIPAARIQRHLFKCRRQYPNAKIDICCFNRAHHVPRQELQDHQKSCPDRALIEVYKYTLDEDTSNTDNSPQTEEQLEQAAAAQRLREEDENWDDMDAPRYNPAEYCMTHPVIRKATHMTPSEKREFRTNERIRIDALNKSMAKNSLSSKANIK